MSNWYGLLADVVVLIHFSFVVFVIAGGVLVLKRRGWIWLHIPAVIWGVLIEIGGWICPLTYWENALREKAGAQVYTGDFVTTYILPILYPAGLTRELQWLFATLVVVINLFIYYRLWVSRRAAAH